MYSEQDIEKHIQDKKLDAPRLSPEDIDNAIQSVQCDVLPGTRTTVCTITLQNGFTTTGINNGPVSAENFDTVLGRQLAIDKARDAIWPLEGYLLAQRLYEEKKRAAMDIDDCPF